MRKEIKFDGNFQGVFYFTGGVNNTGRLYKTLHLEIEGVHSDDIELRVVIKSDIKTEIQSDNK
jgi:hypothetical protein